MAGLAAPAAACLLLLLPWDSTAASCLAIDAQRAKKVVNKCSITRELFSAGRVLSSPRD